MLLVGLTGSINSGKTTFGEYLAESDGSSKHWESWQLVAQVANRLRLSQDWHPQANNIDRINLWLEQLPSVLADICHIDLPLDRIQFSESQLRANPDQYAKLLEYLELVRRRPELSDVIISEGNKDLFRCILQWLGGYLHKQSGANIWYDEIICQVMAEHDLTLATIGGVRFPGDAETVKSVGGSIILLKRENHIIKDQADVTERERDLIQADIVVLNNGSLNELRLVATTVYRDLKLKKAQPEYMAKH